jgi:hypothetical protein
MDLEEVEGHCKRLEAAVFLLDSAGPVVTPDQFRAYLLDQAAGEPNSVEMESKREELVAKMARVFHITLQPMFEIGRVMKAFNEGFSADEAPPSARLLRMRLLRAWLRATDSNLNVLKLWREELRAIGSPTSELDDFEIDLYTQKRLLAKLELQGA